jgi:apolipoprotein D and lipocalin family protein
MEVIIIALDKNYAFSMVCGPDKSYLWILSRTRQLPEETIDALVEAANQQGLCYR